MANQPKRAFHTASEPEIKAGQVSDVYFQRTIQILKAKGITKRVKACGPWTRAPSSDRTSPCS